jgi:hypothetical protein
METSAALLAVLVSKNNFSLQTDELDDACRIRVPFQILATHYLGVILLMMAYNFVFLHTLICNDSDFFGTC